MEAAAYQKNDQPQLEPSWALARALARGQVLADRMLVRRVRVPVQVLVLTLPKHPKRLAEKLRRR